MRLLSSRLQILLALALACVLSLTVALALPGGARAGNGHNAKVEARLAQLADSAGGDADLDVIVVGSDAKNAGRKLGRLKHGDGDLSFVGAAAVKIKAKDIDKLADDSGVDFIGIDSPIAPTGTVDYSQLSTIYPFADKTPVAWNYGYNGQGVGIAVIDSGAVPVADFAGRLVQVQLPWQTNGAPNDVHGHGSLVAGVAAGKSPDGKFIGTAPGSTIYALDVDRPEGTHSSDVIDALQWVFENAHARNIRVVNLSLSETVPGSYRQSTLDLAVERVWAAGIAVVVSAGNSGPISGAVDYAPANDPLALSVGAIDTMGTKATADDIVAGFSSSGLTIDGFAKPDLLAPGRLIASVLPSGTYLDGQAPPANRVAPGYATISGTSFSAPQVAGAAAIVFQQHPDWSPDQLKAVLARKGRAVLGSIVPALNLGFVDNYFGTPPPANQGVPALVCPPSGTTCLTGSTIASSWNSSTWNSSTWNSSTWNSSTWNSSTWNSSTWNSSTWNSSTWNSSTWNSSTWNSSTWNSSTWNSSTWNSFSWE